MISDGLQAPTEALGQIMIRNGAQEALLRWCPIRESSAGWGGLELDSAAPANDRDVGAFGATGDVPVRELPKKGKFVRTPVAVGLRGRFLGDLRVVGAGGRKTESRNPKSEGGPKSEIRKPNPPTHPLTQRRRGSQRFAENSFSLRCSAFLCTAICDNLRSPPKFSWPHVTFATHLTHLTFWLRLGWSARWPSAANGCRPVRRARSKLPP